MRSTGARPRSPASTIASPRLLEPARGAVPPALEPPHLGEDTVVHEGQGSRYTVWLCEHLDHLADHLAELIAPAEHVAQLRRVPWWR